MTARRGVTAVPGSAWSARTAVRPVGSGESCILDKVWRYRAWEGRHGGGVALGLEIPAAAAPIRLRPDFLEAPERNGPGPEPEAARPHSPHDPAQNVGQANALLPILPR